MKTTDVEFTTEESVGDLSLEENLMLTKLHGILFMNALSVLSIVARADAELPPATVKISEISAHGTGCDSTTLKSFLFTSQVLEIDFAGFSADADEATPRQRKTCTIRVPITVPPGFRMALHASEINGNAVTGPLGTGDVVFRFSKAGTSSNMAFTHVEGDFAGQFVVGSQNWPGQPQDYDLLVCNESAEMISQIDLIARKDAYIQLHDLYMPVPEVKRCDEQESHHVF